MLTTTDVIDVDVYFCECTIQENVEQEMAELGLSHTLVFPIVSLDIVLTHLR
jgi:hypothetical protein